MNPNEKYIVGVYDTESEAIQAVEELKLKGYSVKNISVIGKNQEGVELISDETGTKTGEGAAVGATTGGALGGLAGLLAGVGALVIPGIGPMIAAGPIAATLTGAVLGAGTGGVAGALIGMGLSEEEANRYDTHVREGKFLVLVDRGTSIGNTNREALTDDLALTRHNGGTVDPRMMNEGRK